MISYVQTRRDLLIFADQFAGLGETPSWRIDHAPCSRVEFGALDTTDLKSLCSMPTAAR